VILLLSQMSTINRRSCSFALYPSGYYSLNAILKFDGRRIQISRSLFYAATI
jgi:hypothetical protein